MTDMLFSRYSRVSGTKSTSPGTKRDCNSPAPTGNSATAPLSQVRRAYFPDLVQVLAPDPDPAPDTDLDAATDCFRVP